MPGVIIGQVTIHGAVACVLSAGDQADKEAIVRILSYECSSVEEYGLSFSKVKFGKLNLIVGDSGTGKTRFLNTIFNSGVVAVQKKLFAGSWDMIVEQEGKTYSWFLEAPRDVDGKPIISRERICMLGEGEETVIVDRDADSFTFDDYKLPRLSRRESSISILQEEDLIQPLYRGFSSILRRNFSSGELDDMVTTYQNVPLKLLQRIQKEKDLDTLFSAPLNLNCRLYVLSLHFKHVYERICSEFKAVFPFVSQVKLLDIEDFGIHVPVPGVVPVFALKEKTIDKWVPLREFSSGMQKVLLMLTDLFLLPGDGGVYLIDEYENSLGINAINFFPSILLEADNPSQFIITSHHPYIINKVPVKSWFVLHRTGPNVTIKYGDELEERFGKSRQQAFIQLINDPFYVEGIE